jgi:predicted kinase
VGKSTVSEYTAEGLSAVRFRSDEVRYDLFENPAYTPEEIQQTYEEMLDRAGRELDAGRDVVVDGTFKEVSQRDRARAVARETDARLQFVRVTCPPEVVRDRLDDRTDDASDADLSVYKQHRAKFEPLDVEHVCIDNGGSLAETREQVEQKLLG